jgi:hypothetical protein
MNKNGAIFLAVVTTGLSLTISIMPVYGQTLANSIAEGEAKAQNIIAIVPQYAFFRGIRIDYERNLKASDHWLVFAPQLYLDVNNGSNFYYSSGSYANYQSMVGVGLNLYYKTIVFKSVKGNVNSNLPRHSFYVSAGPNFQYFSLQNTEEVAQPFIDNGITYYQFNVENVKKPIYRLGAVGNVGWQMAFDRFLLDFYLGVAVKYSMDGNGNLIKSAYTEWARPDYSGILLDGGIRFGIFF